ncbi:MAG TPA: hypothetical protein ACQGQG_05665 [Xylella sp.]
MNVRIMTWVRYMSYAPCDISVGFFACLTLLVLVLVLVLRMLNSLFRCVLWYECV